MPACAGMTGLVGAKLTVLSKKQADYLGLPQAGPFKHELYRY